MAVSIVKPTVGGSESTWGATINAGLDTIANALNGTAGTVAPNLSALTLNGTDVTATAAELNKLDGLTASTTELNKLNGVTASTAELNKLDGVTATAAELNTASSHYVPSGGIIMWSGSVANIPTGWVLCNGSNSTPNLMDRFVVGAGFSYATGDTGGANTVILSEANMPAHNHTASSSSASHVNDPGHSHNYEGVVPSSGEGNSSRTSVPTTKSTTAAATGITVQTTTVTSIGNTGSGTAHENRPPYYALAYIMKT